MGASGGRGTQVRGPSSAHTTGVVLRGVDDAGAGVADGVMLPLHAATSTARGRAFVVMSDRPSCLRGETQSYIRGMTRMRLMLGITLMTAASVVSAQTPARLTATPSRPHPGAIVRLSLRAPARESITAVQGTLAGEPLHFIRS